MSRLALIALTFALGACASAPPLPYPASPRQFSLAGRVGVKYDERGFSGGLRWRHDAGSDEIFLSTPLGQAVASLHRDADGAELITPEYKRRAADAESLSRAVLGWSLPLSGLQYWIVGEVAPGSPPALIERDGDNRLARLDQHSWQIVFSGYAPPEQGGLPARLTLTYRDLEIRLVIDGWDSAADKP